MLFRWFAFLATSLLMPSGLPAVEKVGNRILGYWQKQELYFVGTCVEANRNIKGGGFLVVFADGDQDVLPHPWIYPLKIKVGSVVLARWKDKKLYSGKVEKIVGDGLLIQFDDGDRGWTSWAGIAVKRPER